MAENKEGQEKTEPASSKRLSEARDRGQVSKSIDITTAASIVVGGMIVFTMGKPLALNYTGFVKDILRQAAYIQLTAENVPHYYGQLILYLSEILLPILLILFVIALAAEIGQVGLKISPKKFTEGLNIKNIFNPFGGLKRILFSSRSVFELAKSIVKVIILGGVVYNILSSRTMEIVSILDKPFTEIAPLIAAVCFELVLKVGAVFAAIAVVDYIFQKRKFKEDLKMTKQEVKEETKQMEGDPKIKSRIRSVMRQRIRKMMLQNVQQADVVITNPTHFAVALSYKPENMSAPVVVAKGLDFLALQIRGIAEEHNITIVEEPPLARMLYFSVEVDREIPENLFKAVAQVLAYVYRLKRMGQAVN